MREHIAQYYANAHAPRHPGHYRGNCGFFSALLAVMFYLRWVSEEWPTPFHFASLLMVAALLCSRFVAASRSRSARRRRSLRTRTGGALDRGRDRQLADFLFLEIVEWVRLVYLEQLGPDTAFGGTYLALTGAHWLAATACVCWIDLRGE